MVVNIDLAEIDLVGGNKWLKRALKYLMDIVLSIVVKKENLTPWFLFTKRKMITMKSYVAP